MPCSQTPAGPLRLTVEETLGAGSRCCRRLSPRRIGVVPVPQSVPWSCLAASRRSVVAFRPSKGVGSRDGINFGAQQHGLVTRCLRLATFLPASAVVRPPKTHFRLVVNLGRVGLVTHEVPCKVSALYIPSSLPRLCLAQWTPYPLVGWTSAVVAPRLTRMSAIPLRSVGEAGWRLSPTTVDE